MHEANALEILSEYRDFVWPELKKYLKMPEFPDQFSIESRYLKELQKHMDMLCEYPERKGKYLRPTLVLLTALALGAKKDDVVKTAVAMQLSEDWILIHDDLEDNSIQRRGGPCLHRKYSPGLSINAGDGLHIIMWKALIDNFLLLGKRKGSLIANEFQTMLSRTMIGQSVEMIWRDLDKKTTYEDKDWYFIADSKTGYYTVSGPMRLGAIIAGANDTQISLVTEFGKNLGRCFQIVDDLLDISGDFSGQKKQYANDIYEGKRTLIIGHLIRNSTDDEKKKILAILNKNREEKTENEVSWIVQKMHQKGSLNYAKSEAKNFKDISLKLFEDKLDFLFIEPYRTHIKKISKFILDRDH